MVSKLVHSAKCQYYTERIALVSSSKELHQIVNTPSNRHPPKILPAIYPRADLPSLFIRHFDDKVEKHGNNIASEPAISTSTPVTVTTTATFASLEKVSQSTVKECIPNYAPKSCELDPIPSKLLIKCLDSILTSLTDLFNSPLHLAFSHNASSQLLSYLGLCLPLLTHTPFIRRYPTITDVCSS